MSSSINIWKEPMTMMLRFVIGDMDPPFVYTNDRLENLLIYGAFFVYKDVTFNVIYTIDPSFLTIVPDPVVNKDFAFVNLSVLKSACILSRNQLATQAKQAISWKDGQSHFDGRELAKSQKFVVDNICGEFEQAKMQFQFGDTVCGKALLGPFSSDRISFGTNQGFFGEGIRNSYVGGRQNNDNFSSQSY